MFEPFQKLLPLAAQKKNISREWLAIKVCQDFRTILLEIFTTQKEIAQYVQPAFYKDSILHINVENSAWAQEIIMKKEQILKELNKKIGKNLVKSLRTQLTRPAEKLNFT
ncbi:MAG: DUF721 domain-containing protein [Patescibacteria group bacterium]